jgi:hypothetical protein
VPIGGRLVKASRLFLRLGDDLAPFMFELPRAFGACDRVFKAITTWRAMAIESSIHDNMAHHHPDHRVCCIFTPTQQV